MKKASKRNKLIWWLLGSMFIVIFGIIFTFMNFRTYGLYYAKQYYGKDSYYQLLREDFKTNTNSKEKRQYKDVFELSSEDKSKSIILGHVDKDFRIGIQQESVGQNFDVFMQNISKSAVFYMLDEKNKLEFSANDKNGSEKRPRNFERIYEKDTKDFEKYMTQYLDIQLELIGKPIINLQWIYNLVQMI